MTELEIGLDDRIRDEKIQYDITLSSGKNWYV